MWEFMHGLRIQRRLSDEENTDVEVARNILVSVLIIQLVDYLKLSVLIHNYG
jgi:hypothetical protein